MWPEQEKKKTIISGLIVGGLILFLGIGVFYQNTKSPQLFNSKAAPTSLVHLTSPNPNSSIGGIVSIEAQFVPQQQYTRLYAILKFGSQNSIPMDIKVESGQILLSGTLNVSEHPSGEYPLKIFVYDEAGDQPTLVGEGTYQINVVH